MLLRTARVDVLCFGFSRDGLLRTLTCFVDWVRRRSVFGFVLVCEDACVLSEIACVDVTRALACYMGLCV